MTQDSAPKNGRTSAPSQAMSREDRLKAALKANMARRKAQAKARAAVDVAAEAGGNAHAVPRDDEQDI